MAMASASGYNHHRFARSVLKKSRKWEPSLAVQLFPNHWRFENSVSPPPQEQSLMTAHDISVSRSNDTLPPGTQSAGHSRFTRPVPL